MEKTEQEETMRRALSLLKKEELIELILGFVMLDVRTPITLFRSYTNTLNELMKTVLKAIGEKKNA